MPPIHPHPAYQSGDCSFESTSANTRSRYSGPWPPPDVVRIPPPQLPGKEVFPPPDVPPLALCHVCSVCGRMRSAGYHRHHPIIPGQALTSTPCRRCKKRAKKARERREKDRARQEEDNELSERFITIRIDNGERRGRTRGHEERRKHSLSPERRSGRTRGLPDLVSRGSTRVEYRTLRDDSPERSPPPALRRRTRSEVRFSSTNSLPTDVRVGYRTEVDERQRSPSPDARARLAAHPSAFRTVTPMSIPGYYPEDPQDPPPALPRGILKAPSQFYESQPTRHMAETSYDSMVPEVGGNRVQFGRESRPHTHAREPSARCVTCRDERCTCDEEDTYRFRRRYQYQRGYVEEIPSPEIPSQTLERFHTREESPDSRRIQNRSNSRRPEPVEHHHSYVRTEHNRDTSGSYENAAHQVPPAVDDRGRARDPHGARRRDSPPPRRATSQLRDLDRRVGRESFPSPPRQPSRRHDESDDATDSDSEVSGEHYIVRYREVDENGRLYTVVEERTRKALPANANPRAPAGPLALGEAEGPAITRGFAYVRDV